MLNNTKKELQCKWFVKLNEEIYKKLDAKLADIPDDETVIAAMPEFFWRNINDNQKHTDPHEIINYGKSFSYEVKEIWPDSKPEDEYSFQKLTTRYPNLILFAGTVWWKKDDLIRNSIPIFANGPVSYTHLDVYKRQHFQYSGYRHFAPVPAFSYFQ